MGKKRCLKILSVVAVVLLIGSVLGLYFESVDAVEDESEEGKSQAETEESDDGEREKIEEEDEEETKDLKTEDSDFPPEECSPIIVDHEEHDGPVRGVYYTGDYIFSVGEDGYIRRYDTNGEDQETRERDIDVTGLSIDGDVNGVYVGTEEGEVLFIDEDLNEDENEKHDFHDDRVYSVNYGKETVYSGSNDGKVIAASLDGEWSEEWIHSRHNAGVRSVFYNEGVVYSGSYDNTVMAYEPGEDGGKVLWQHDIHDSTVRSVFVDGDGVVYSGSADGTVVAYDHGREEENRTLFRHRIHDEPVNSVQVNHNYGDDEVKVVYSTSADGTVVAYKEEIEDGAEDEERWKKLWQHEEHDDAVWALDYNSNKERLVSGGRDNRVMSLQEDLYVLNYEAVGLLPAAEERMYPKPGTYLFDPDEDCEIILDASIHDKDDEEKDDDFWEFQRWLGDVNENGLEEEELEVKMDQHRTIYAYYQGGVKEDYTAVQKEKNININSYLEGFFIEGVDELENRYIFEPDFYDDIEIEDVEFRFAGQYSSAQEDAEGNWEMENEFRMGEGTPNDFVMVDVMYGDDVYEQGAQFPIVYIVEPDIFEAPFAFRTMINHCGDITIEEDGDEAYWKFETHSGIDFADDFLEIDTEHFSSPLPWELGEGEYGIDEVDIKFGFDLTSQYYGKMISLFKATSGIGWEDDEIIGEKDADGKLGAEAGLNLGLKGGFRIPDREDEDDKISLAFEGRATISLSADAEYTIKEGRKFVMIGKVPVTISWDISAEGGAQLEFELSAGVEYDDSIGTLPLELDAIFEAMFGISIDLKGGVGIPGASAGAYFEGGFYVVLDILDSIFDRFLIEAELGLYAELLLWETRYALWSDSWEWDPFSSASIHGLLSEEELDPGWQPMERDWLGDDYSEFVWEKGQPEGQLVERTFTNPQPTITVEEDGSKLAAWTHDDPQQDELTNSLEIAYSRYDPEEEEWSEPKTITNDEYSDLNPELSYLDGGKVMAVWQRIDTDIEAENSQPGDIGEDIELSYSIYDPEEGDWSDAELITSNDQYDAAPVLANQGDHTMLAWTRDPEGNPVSTTGLDLLASEWKGDSWSEPELVESGITIVGEPDLALREDGTGIVAFARDMDDDISTPEKAEIFVARYDGSWGSPERLTRTDVEDRDPSVVPMEEGWGLSWIRTEGTMNSILFAEIDDDGSKLGTEKVIDGEAVTSQELLAGDDDKNLRLAYQGGGLGEITQMSRGGLEWREVGNYMDTVDEEGEELEYGDFSADRSSDHTGIITTEKLWENMDEWDNENETRPSETSLYFTNAPASYFEIEITSPEEGEEFVEGDEVPIEYVVENIEDSEDTQDIEIDVYDEEENIVYSSLDTGVTVGSKQSQEGQSTWYTEEGYTGEYEIVVSSEDEEKRVNVTLTEGGEFELELVYFDEEVERGEDAIVEAIVENTGGTQDSEKVDLIVGEETVDSEVVSLEPEDKEEITLVWDTGDAEIGQHDVNLTTEDDHEEISITVLEAVEFQVDILEYDEEVFEGEEATIEYHVNNIGEGEGEQDILISIGDQNFTVEEDLFLTSGEIHEGEFKWETEEGDEGEYEVLLKSYDDEDDILLTVVKGYKLLINIEGDGEVELDGDKIEDRWEAQFEEGTTVTLDAVPQDGSEFDRWSDGYGDDDRTMVEIGGDVEITAYFTEEEETSRLPFILAIVVVAIFLGGVVYYKKFYDKPPG